MNGLIKLKHISKTFLGENNQSLIALKDINLEIFEGEFFVFLGPSGSGKSTLLRIMNGFESPSSGKIKFDEKLSFTDFSFVFQQFALFPWLTVNQNIELGIASRHLGELERKTIVEGEVNRLGLRRFEDAYPKELSGGMRQRVGIGRALVKEPKIILMDEPFSELDSFTAEELREEILKMWTEKKLTIVMVTHLIEEALELGDRIAVMTPRPGHIEKIIENDLPRPRNKRSQSFYHLYDDLYKLIKP